MKEHGDTCPPYRLGIEDVAQICYGTKPPSHNVPSEWEGIETALNRDDIILIQEALRTRYDHLESMIARNTDGNLLAECCAQQKHIVDLKLRLTKFSQPASQVQKPLESESAEGVSNPENYLTPPIGWERREPMDE